MDEEIRPPFCSIAVFFHGVELCQYLMIGYVAYSVLPQLIGVFPSFISMSLVFEKSLQQKKPLYADSGEG